MANDKLIPSALIRGLNLFDLFDSAVARMNLGVQGTNSVVIPKSSNVTGGKGTVDDPWIWTGGIWLGARNILLDGYYTLTGTVHMTADYTHLVGQGFVKVTYTGSGDAIHVHTSAAGDPDTGEDDTHVTLFQRIENLWLHVNGSASGAAVAGNAIDLDESHDCLIRNVRVSGRWAAAFYVGNCTNWELDHCATGGSDPLQFNWTLADSPDCALRLGKRAGNLFGPQNGHVLSPWFRFCKQYGVYSDGGDFGTTIIAGQIGDCGINLICYAAYAETLTVIGTDTEFGAAPTGGLDADGNGTAITLKGRGHRLINVHTFGSLQLNDSFEVTLGGGHYGKVWFQTSTACRIEDAYLIGFNGRVWDAGTSPRYYARTRADQNFNPASGIGEYDVFPQRALTGNLSISGTASISQSFTFGGGAQLEPFPGHTSWLDFPNTGGAAGIGDSGPGANLWLGRANANNQFFSDAIAGDILSRASNGGSIRWGTAASGASSMSLSGTALTLSTPLNLASAGLVFSATATAPANTTTPVAWASVKVGSTVYKTPLYQ